MGETMTYFEEKMKELVTKGVEKAIEKAMEAVRQSLAEWAIERQTTAAKHQEAPFNTKRDEHTTLQAGMTSTLTELKLTSGDKVEGSANRSGMASTGLIVSPGISPEFSPCINPNFVGYDELGKRIGWGGPGQMGIGFGVGYMASGSGGGPGGSYGGHGGIGDEVKFVNVVEKLVVASFDDGNSGNEESVVLKPLVTNPNEKVSEEFINTRTPVEVTFDVNGENRDEDDSFTHLVAGDSNFGFCSDEEISKKQCSNSDSDCEWEEINLELEEGRLDGQIYVSSCLPNYKEFDFGRHCFIIMSRLSDKHDRDVKDTFNFESRGQIVDGLKFTGGSNNMMPKSFIKDVTDMAHKHNGYVSTGDWPEHLLRRGPSGFKEYLEECKRLVSNTVELNMGSLGFPEETLLRFGRLMKNAGLKAKPQFSVKFEKSDIPKTGDKAYGSYVVPTPQTSEMIEDMDLLIKRAERCLNAGADMIMIDADDVCKYVGTVRSDVIAKVIGRLGLEKIMFETSNSKTSEWVINQYGPKLRHRIRKGLVYHTPGSDPRKPTIGVTAISHSFNGIAMIDNEYKEWTFLADIKGIYKSDFIDLVWYKDNVDAVRAEGAIVFLNESGVVRSLNPQPDTVGDFYGPYWVESSGDFLISAQCFKVYRLNLDTGDWIHVSGLGRHSLFVGNSYSISRLISEDETGDNWRPSCIYNATYSSTSSEKLSCYNLIKQQEEFHDLGHVTDLNKCYDFIWYWTAITLVFDPGDCDDHKVTINFDFSLGTQMFIRGGYYFDMIEKLVIHPFQLKYFSSLSQCKGSVLALAYFASKIDKRNILCTAERVTTTKRVQQVNSMLSNKMMLTQTVKSNEGIIRTEGVNLGEALDFSGRIFSNVILTMQWRLGISFQSQNEAGKFPGRTEIVADTSVVCSFFLCTSLGMSGGFFRQVGASSSHETFTTGIKLDPHNSITAEYSSDDLVFQFFKCEICVELRPFKESFPGKGCSHLYSSDCIHKYVALKLQFNIIPCPDSGCKGLLEPEYCKSILLQEVFNRWGDALCEALILCSATYTYTMKLRGEEVETVAQKFPSFDLEDKVVLWERGNVMDRPNSAGLSTYNRVQDRPKSRKVNYQQTEIYNPRDKAQGGYRRIVLSKLGLIGRGWHLESPVLSFIL